MQDTIATAVVDAMRPRLVADVPAVPATEPAAYAHYLRGRYLDNLKGRDNWEKAVAAYREALAIDPQFAPAWAGLSLTYFYQTNSRLLPRDSGAELAREAALQAIAIDDNQADAWATLAQIRIALDADVPGAIDAIRNALRRQPTNSDVLNQAGSLAVILGDPDTAIDYYQRAIARDPLNQSPQNALGIAYMLAGNLDRAADTLQELIALNPGYPWAHVNLARVFLLQGDPAAALAAVQNSPPGVWHDAIAVMAHHALGDTGKADESLRQFTADYGDTAPMILAEIHAWRGDIDAAFASLEQALASRDISLMYLRGTPALARLREDPRWPALLDRIGLLEPPRLPGPPLVD
jgi:tetratricopeptide (TPR) repeat protein